MLPFSHITFFLKVNIQKRVFNQNLVELGCAVQLQRDSKRIDIYSQLFMMINFHLTLEQKFQIIRRETLNSLYSYISHWMRKWSEEIPIT